jgi:hypothetical protein
MQIERSNYEIWLIDWIDGNLSDTDIAMLTNFLTANPDLKAEFDEVNSLKDAMHFRPNKSFPNKEKLIKTSADLTGSQFEYLCAAYLENDLSDDQKTEFLQSIKHDADKKKSFELIQKMKLTPPDVFFKRKNRLIRRSVGQKTLRIAIIGLSAAAMISLVILNRISFRGPDPVKADVTAFEIEINTPILKPSIQTGSDKSIPIKNSRINNMQLKNPAALLSQIAPPVKTNLSTSKSVPIDTAASSSDNPRIILNRISVPERLTLGNPVIPATLISLGSRIQIPEEDDGRPRFGRFLAKAFRQKILKENTNRDSPLKAYEIAEAGVSGLNKLLGWEMAPDERKDEKGILKSVYFSSKIIKFNAPVKNSEPLR